MPAALPDVDPVDLAEQHQDAAPEGPVSDPLPKIGTAEAGEADALEQWQTVAPAGQQAAGEPSQEADPADVAEQAVTLPLEDDDHRE